MKRNNIFRSQKPSFDFKVWSWLSDLSLTHISGKNNLLMPNFLLFLLPGEAESWLCAWGSQDYSRVRYQSQGEWRWTERRLVMDATEVNTLGLSPHQAQSSFSESRVVSCFTLVPLLTVPHNKIGWIETLFITRRTNWSDDIAVQVWRLAKLYSWPCIWCVVLNSDESWAEEGA